MTGLVSAWEAKLAAKERQSQAELDQAVAAHNRALEAQAKAHQEALDAHTAADVAHARKHAQTAARLEAQSKSR